MRSINTKCWEMISSVVLRLIMKFLEKLSEACFSEE